MAFVAESLHADCGWGQVSALEIVKIRLWLALRHDKVEPFVLVVCLAVLPLGTGVVSFVVGF